MRLNKREDADDGGRLIRENQSSNENHAKEKHRHQPYNILSLHTCVSLYFLQYHGTGNQNLLDKVRCIDKDVRLAILLIDHEMWQNC